MYIYWLGAKCKKTFLHTSQDPILHKHMITGISLTASGFSPTFGHVLCALIDMRAIAIGIAAHEGHEVRMYNT